MSSEQIAVRLPGELMAKLDELVRRGRYESRAAAVRAGVETLARVEAERVIDDAVVAGYRRVPPTPEDRSAALASLREAIEEEPW
jgi:Arc/MetJ-type ribon-helix-helix transcriptional regulator